MRHAKVSGGTQNDETEYTVATNAMLSAGGHKYVTFGDGTDRKHYGGQYDTIRDRFGTHSPVSPPEPGRITRANGK